ncbi:Interleukin enhancer-binding factor 2 -like protein, partial [Caligus rogercresseyi]
MARGGPRGGGNSGGGNNSSNGRGGNAATLHSSRSLRRRPCGTRLPPVKTIPPAFEEGFQARNQDLTPSQAETTAITNLVNKIQNVLDGLIVSPGNFEACQIEEVRQVGTFKKGTMIAGNNVAYLVVVLKTLPTKEAIEALGKKVWETLKLKEPKE